MFFKPLMSTFTNKFLRHNLVVLACFVFLSDCSVCVNADEVMIISSGPNAPDTVYLSRNVEALERVPLDGVATWIATPIPIRGESGEMFTARLSAGRLCRVPSGEDGADVGQTVVPYAPNRWWPTDRISDELVAPAIADLRAAKFNRFRSNFIHCITGNPGKPMNWFDDVLWATICHNVGMIAKVSKQGGCRGILIDPEDYSYSWWSYPILTEMDTDDVGYRRGNREFYRGKTFDQVRAKVRQRGREFARAINAEFHDPVLMFFHAIGYAAAQINDERWDSIDQAGFGLMVPFLDGLLEGSSDGTVIVDCTSQAKWWTQRAQLENARKEVKQDGRALSQVPKLYDRKIKLGFCYRLGYHPQEEQIEGRGPAGYSGLFDPSLPHTNFFSPQKLEETLKMALEIGDGYILFWNARANWWLDSVDARPAGGAPINRKSRWVPRVYWKALENVRAVEL